eukprot:Colp12_sorted_trinity150504_noHs@24571
MNQQAPTGAQVAGVPYQTAKYSAGGAPPSVGAVQPKAGVVIDNAIPKARPPIPARPGANPVVQTAAEHPKDVRQTPPRPVRGHHPPKTQPPPTAAPARPPPPKGLAGSQEHDLTRLAQQQCTSKEKFAVFLRSLTDLVKQGYAPPRAANVLSFFDGDYKQALDFIKDVDQLCSLGFEEQIVGESLLLAGGNKEKALDWLLAHQESMERMKGSKK